MKLKKNLFIFFVFFIFGCSRYSIENFIGTPKAHLENDSVENFILVKSKLDQVTVYNKLKTYLYKNQADIYSQDKISYIYVRNLVKIYKNCSNTSDMYIQILRDEKDKTTLVKFNSLNRELAEFFADKFEDILSFDNNITNSKKSNK